MMWLFMLMAAALVPAGPAEAKANLPVPPIIDLPRREAIQATYIVDCGGKIVELSLNPSRSEAYVINYKVGGRAPASADIAKWNTQLKHLAILGRPSFSCVPDAQIIVFHGFFREKDDHLTPDNVLVIWDNGHLVQ